MTLQQLLFSAVTPREQPSFYTPQHLSNEELQTINGFAVQSLCLCSAIVGGAPNDNIKVLVGSS